MRSLIQDLLAVLQAIHSRRAASGGDATSLRIGAVHSVAENELSAGRFRNRISALNSIQDACARRFGLDAAGFDKLVELWLAGDPTELRCRLLTIAGHEQHRTELESLFPERVQLPPEAIHPETLPEGKDYVTGAVREVKVNAYERDPEARRECIQRHGTTCAVCLMNFEQRYGRIGKDFIHVHHLRLLSSREVYNLNPMKDLIPVCPNCHAMLHSSNPPRSVGELKSLMAEALRNQTSL